MSRNAPQGVSYKGCNLNSDDGKHKNTISKQANKKEREEQTK